MVRLVFFIFTLFCLFRWFGVWLGFGWVSSLFCLLEEIYLSITDRPVYKLFHHKNISISPSSCQSIYSRRSKMSIQWTFIAGYLYFEIAIVTLMMLPIASPRRWNQFFKSRLFSMFRENAAVYFYVALGVLFLFLIDAVREIRKYTNSKDSSHAHLTSDLKDHVKLFRAQRNFYITGFAIFLAFVIRRLVTMLVVQAELLDKSEKIIKEAENAKNMAKDAINAHTLQSAGDAQNQEDMTLQLEVTQQKLEQEKSKVRELQTELAKMKAQSNRVGDTQ